MTQAKTTKRALLLSCLSMLLCMSMLVGTTFAWFTDSASTGVNTIQSGNLDIKLSYKNASAGDYTEVSAKATDLFVNSAGEAILWEPGATAVCYFKLENLGSLALQYKLSISYEDTVVYNDVKLSNALKSAIVELKEGETLANDAAVAAVMKDGAVVALGHKDAEGIKMESGDVRYFAIVIHMPTTVENTYNLPAGQRPLEIQLGVDLIAAQVMHENDSYGDTYDQYPGYPAFPDRIFVAETLPYTSEQIKIEDYEKGYWITIPAGAITPADSNPNPTNVTVAFNAESGANQVTYTLSITDEKNNALTLNKAATIVTGLGLGLEDVASDDAAVTYTESNGQIKITAASAGSYVVTYNNPNVTVVSNAEQFIAAFKALETKPGQTISLASDIDLANSTWAGVDNLSFTLLGNGYTISNITNTEAHSQNKAAGGIVNFLGAGNSVVIKNVTLDTLTIGDETDVAVAGGVVGYVDAAREVTIEGVTVKNATILSTDDGEDTLHYAGGFIGYGVGYQNTNDGAVYTLINIKNCTLTADEGKANTITNKCGTTGGAIGHASASSFTTTTITNFKAENTVLTAETNRTNKCGIITGTAHAGKTVIEGCDATDFANVTVQGTANSKVIVGRLVTNSTGVLTINGTEYTVDENTISLS